MPVFLHITSSEDGRERSEREKESTRGKINNLKPKQARARGKKPNVPRHTFWWELLPTRRGGDHIVATQTEGIAFTGPAGGQAVNGARIAFHTERRADRKNMSQQK